MFWKNSGFRQLELVTVAEKRPKKSMINRGELALLYGKNLLRSAFGQKKPLLGLAVHAYDFLPKKQIQRQSNDHTCVTLGRP